jgi:DnaJ-class molecular chaperone
MAGETKRAKPKPEMNGSVPVSPGDQATPGTPGTGEVPCRECHGSGKIAGRSCPNCGGSGRVVAGIGGA